MKWTLLLFPCIAFASGQHDHTAINNNTINQNSSYKVVNEGSGTALGIASSQLHFDAGTLKSQVGVGVGRYDDSEAISFGAAKVFDDMMINGTIGIEDGEKGYGAGISWQF